MGWTDMTATHFTRSGNIDRKAECDSLCSFENDTNSLKVLKSAMVGSTYYAAIRTTNKITNESKVWAAIFLTSVNSKSHFNFSYKDMEETVGPCECDCPNSILNILDDTDNEAALLWRSICRKNNEEKKLNTVAFNRLKELPVGTVIKTKVIRDLSVHKKGTELILTKSVFHGKEYWHDYHYKYRRTQFDIKNFEILN